MKPAERYIDVEHSNFAIRRPSTTAQRTFFYLLRAGVFRYEPHYHLERNTFDSFLIIYMQSGSMHFTLPNGTYTADEGQFAVVDCYNWHSYNTHEQTDVLWAHFDGKMARAYFDLIVNKLGNVFSLRNTKYAVKRLEQMYAMIAGELDYSEARVSKYIMDVLTEFVAEQDVDTAVRQSQVIEDSIAYISSNLERAIPIEELAERAYLSKYHFIRLFKKETGFTPHAYIVDTRIHLATYLLVNSELTLKQICGQCGFSSTSMLCAVFKEKIGMSPLEYRIAKRGMKEKQSL